MLVLWIFDFFWRSGNAQKLTVRLSGFLHNSRRI
jgi:hypothetical protein